MAFTLDQWVILLLVFLLGLFLGGAMFASPKWKRRHRDEVRRREELEREHAQFRKEAQERDMLRDAAMRHPIDRDRGPL
ncbi:hypothetical protein [Sphingosinicella humi]|uniref:Uncharacterized protein n=1 Tax=Allosphingosinicella humi TaxID=2068657 RepID=A0A2U2J4M6_9SPHN|nr:hypothetical protein [Sphingosinicella humi]PWG03278.1 hypothetical protein DF286_10680 [Sphingosinicella humi]